MTFKFGETVRIVIWRTDIDGLRYVSDIIERDYVGSIPLQLSIPVKALAEEGMSMVIERLPKPILPGGVR